MSKNLTRKGLAFGASVALGTTLFAGAPAFAAGEVALEVSAGTGNATIVGETFTVKANLGSQIPDSNAGQLKFAITNSAATGLTYEADGDAVTASVQGTTNVDGAAGTTSSGTADVVAATTSVTRIQSLGIKTTSASAAATTVTVVAFLDADGGNDLDSGEFQTAPYTINFVKVADAGISIAQTVPQVGDTTLKAKITSSAINLAQVAAGNFKVQFGKYVSGTKTTQTATGYTYAASPITGGDTVSLNSTTKASLDASVAVASGNDVTAGTYVARAIYSPDAGTTAWAAVGSEVETAVGAVSVNGTQSSYKIVAGENVTTLGVVRKGYTSDVVYEVTVKDADKKLLAGKTVRLTVTAESSVGTIKINGVSASATDFDAVSDANGVAKFVVTNDTADASDSLTISTIKSEGVTISSSVADLDWADASYTVVEKSTYTAGSSYVSVDAAGTSASMTFVLVDQWKKPLSSASYRLQATVTGRSVATVRDDFADGSATFTVTDGKLTTDAFTSVAFDLQSGTNFATTTPQTGARIYWYNQADKVDITETSVSATRAVKRLVAVDTRLSNDPAAATTSSAPDEVATINGTVAHATSALAKAGAKITVSGDASILFEVGGVYAFGSLTFWDNDGSYAINAYSNKVQTDSVVTVTSNGASDTVKVSFNASTVAAEVKSVTTVAAAASIVPGRTVLVTVSALDEFGNVVELTSTNSEDALAVTYTGPGYLTSSPTTLTKGKATFTVVTGPADAGTVAITAEATLGASDSLKGSASITVAAAPVVVPEVKTTIVGVTKAVRIRVENAKGEEVEVKFGSKTVAVAIAGTNSKLWVLKTTKGKKSVKVYVDGDLVAVKTVTVK